MGRRPRRTTTVATVGKGAGYKGLPRQRDEDEDGDEDGLLDDLGALEELDFASMPISQLATVVRRTYGTRRRAPVLQRLDPNLVTPSNAMQFFTAEERMQVREIFDTIDADGSDSIDLAEIREGFRAMEVDFGDEDLVAMALQSDQNGDDVIDFDEFAALILRVEIGIQLGAARKKGLQRVNSVLQHLVDPDSPYRGIRWLSSARRAVWRLFDDPASSRAAQVLAVLLVGTILCSCALFVVESTPAFQGSAELTALAAQFETTSVAVFSVEFASRLLCCPSLRRFAKSPLNWVDLLAVLPFYVERFLEPALAEAGMTSMTNSEALRVVRLVRIFRMLKIGRYFRWTDVFVKTFEQSVLPLGMTLLLLLVGIVTFSSLVFYCERGDWDQEVGVFYGADGQESFFQSIPASFWWTMSTVTTVGYGDMYPTQPLGQLVASCSAVFGVLLLAIPISVLNTNFKYEYEKMLTKKELESEQGAAAGDTREAILDNLLRNRHLCRVMASSDFALSSVVSHEKREHQCFAAAVYKSCRTNQKRAFTDFKHRERDNRHHLVESLAAVQTQYLTSRELDGEVGVVGVVGGVGGDAQASGASSGARRRRSSSSSVSSALDPDDEDVLQLLEELEAESLAVEVPAAAELPP